MVLRTANNRLHTNQVNVAWFCDLRPATGAPYKGRPRPTNLSGLLGHLPYKGRHNDERIAEGDKPRATNHEPRTTGPLREPTPKGVI